MVCSEVNIGHIDTAARYGNESSVNAALKELGKVESDVFIATKCAENVDPETSLEKSLQLLGCTQVDLFMIHCPKWVRHISLQDAWRQMESLQAVGEVTSIGISNYRISDLEETLRVVKVVPAVNQIEVHPYVYDKAKPLIDYCHSKGIRIATYTTLAPITNYPGGPVDPIVERIATELRITNDQVLIKWAHQVSYGGIVVTTSSKKDRILGQMHALTEVRDLSHAEIEEIAEAGMQKHQRVWWQYMDED